MSSRQLRKLQKQRELEEAQARVNQDSEEEEEEEEEVVADSRAGNAKPRVSLFAALGGDDDNDEDEDEQDVADKSQIPVSQVGEDPTPAEPSKSKKKKKKKKKSKAQVVAKVEPEQEDDDEDEIDKALKELKLAKGNQTTGNEEVRPQSKLNELLSINTHHLRAINEMRQLFGRDIIESAQADEDQEQNRRQRGHAQRQVDLETFLRGPPGQKKLPEVSLRRNVFIQGREHWPMATTGGLGMKALGPASDGSSIEYTFQHGKDYDIVQAIFFQYVGMGDPMRMVYLLQQFPYHVSTLLQVSFVAKQDQNMALSSELCERALFTFGRVATSAFRSHLESGKARLDFRRPENRQLWLSGYHYLKSLIRKGTYRTALEWARLLFSLDHNDPYAMRHYIQFLAIRAYESRWFIDFITELEATSDNRDTAYLRQSIVLAKLQLNDMDGAKAELREGMTRVPWLYCSLFQDLGIDAPPSIWGVSPDTDNKSFWTSLYIYQMKDLWNNTAAMSLLRQVAKGLEKVDKSALSGKDDPPVDLGSTRLVYLEGQTSLMALAPRSLLEQQPNYEFDPLPPPEEDNIFSGDGCRLPWLDLKRGSAVLEPQIEAQLRNILANQQARAGNGAGPPPIRRGGILGGDDESDEDVDDLNPELMAEFQANIQEHLREGGTDGWMNRLMDIFRRPDNGPQQSEGDSGNAGNAGNAGESRDRPNEGPLPGAWPEEDDQR